MNRIVTFGEIMLRLATPGYLRFSQATSFEATYGGGEANVAVEDEPSSTSTVRVAGVESARPKLSVTVKLTV